MVKNKSQFFFLGLLLITVAYFCFQVFSFRNDIFKKFDSTYWTKRYFASQWVVPNSKNSIGDDGLYMYAGYRYIKGDDPTLLNAELPPLGKYVVGLFEITTGYNGIFSVFFCALTLILLYFFNKTIFSSSFLALLPVTIFSFDPLFTQQIRAPYLDMFYLCWLLIGFLFFLKNKYIPAGIAFGAFMATKSPFLVLVVYATLFVWLMLRKKLSLKKMLLLIIPTIFVFFLSYSAVFFHGHNLLYILKVQKYIIHFYSIGAKPVFGAVFPMLTTGTWYNWFGPVQKVTEWSLLWPIAGIGSLLSVFFLSKRPNEKILFTVVWIGIYLAFLAITPLFARYLLLLLPFLYNLSIWSFSAVIKHKST